MMMDMMDISRKRILQVLAVQIVLAFSFTTCALNSMNACYLVEQDNSCVTGLDQVFFAVSKGESFHVG